MYKKLFLCACLVFALSASASALDFWWDEDTTGDLWSDGSHWDQSGAVPGMWDGAGINGGVCIIDSTVTAVAWTVRGPGWVGHSGEYPQLNITGGSLTTISDWSFGMYGPPGTGGTANITTDTGIPDIDVGGNMHVGGPGGGSTAILNMYGGTIDIGNTLGVDSGILYVPWTAANHGIANLYGGTITCYADNQWGAAVQINGDGYINITEGALVLKGDFRWFTLPGWYVDTGAIRAYDGAGTVDISYDGTWTTFTAVPPPIEVAVDIKPESCPNPLVVKGKGVLTAAILGSCVLDVQDIDAASIELAGAPAIRSRYEDVASLATVMVDDMDDIAATHWTDDREPGEGGIGLLQQGAGTMVLDYGNTTDSAGTPHPEAGYDLNGNWVGHGNQSGGAFNSGGGGQDDWDSGYRGKWDRVPSRPFAPGEIPCLTDCSVFVLDVYKSQMGSEHARSLQLYDSTGARSTYHIQSEGGADPPAVPGATRWGSTIGNTPAGWSTFCIPINAANVDEEDNADKCDIVTIKIWCSSWAALARELNNPYEPGTPEYDCWPCWTHGDWMATMHSGGWIELDNLRLVSLDGCDDCTTETGSDGFTDLVLKFNRADIVAGLGAVHHGDVVTLDLTGSLLSGQPIEGADCVNIVGKADPAQRPPKK